jgi:polygalacturonase
MVHLTVMVKHGMISSKGSQIIPIGHKHSPYTRPRTPYSKDSDSSKAKCGMCSTHHWLASFRGLIHNRTMTVLKSDGVLLQNIYVNSTSSSGSPARNTDGADTIYSNNIHFDQWTVVNGDDSISLKANSTNILITNSTFYNGLGVAIGSIGQYKGVWETIENVTASHISFYKTLHGGYVKTWTGEQVGYPPNGGGGGLGCE